MASIRKRTWKSGGQLKTAWIADYFDQAGRRHIKTFKTRKEADGFMVKARHQVSQGTHVADRATVSVSEAVDTWLEVCEKVGRRGREPVEPHTLRVYKTHGRHIKDIIGSTKLNRLSGPICVEFRDQLLERLSRRNSAKVLTSFKSVLREARSRGLMATDPAEDVSIVVSARQRNRLTVADGDQAGEIPSPEQLACILAAADRLLEKQEISPRDRVLVYTIPLTGMRLSEARGFPWPNYDPAALTMRVTQRASETGEIGPPKTAAGYRTLYAPHELAEILKEWRGHCPLGPLQLMFPNGRGNPESGANLHNRVWKLVMKAAGLVDPDGKPLFDLKSLRHFYASYRIAQGADPKQIQVEMGHSNMVVTLGIYGHLFPDETGERSARATSMGADLMHRRAAAATRLQHEGQITAAIRVY
jgi:integrase